MAMPGRKFSAGTGYRYGFNGKENDKDISEGGQDYGMRIYDSRLGKFLSVDPLYQSYPWNSTYAFSENDVIRCIDLDGQEKKSANTVNDTNDGSSKLTFSDQVDVWKNIIRFVGCVSVQKQQNKQQLQLVLLQ